MDITIKDLSTADKKVICGNHVCEDCPLQIKYYGFGICYNVITSILLKFEKTVIKVE